MSDAVSFQIHIDQQNGIRTISVSGVIDENSDLSFFEHLDGPTRFNMRNVRRINSYGVRAWIEGIRAVP
jgi:hypothetical protein